MDPAMPTPTDLLPCSYRAQPGFVLLLLAGSLLAGCDPGVATRVSIDEQLHQTGLRHHTFGPTGERLFTERYDTGLGIRGRYSYIHYAEIDNPIVLTFEDAREVLEPTLERSDWYPSGRVDRGAIGMLHYTERKFISDDDTFVDEVTLYNPSGEGLACRLKVTSGFARTLARFGSTFTTVDLSDHANTHPYPGSSIFETVTGGTFRAWYEAEHPIEQEGSHGRDVKKAASGGEVLGMRFGAARGHNATYRFALPVRSEVHLYLRVARELTSATEKSARWSWALDGRDSHRFDIAPTSGWGDQEQDFRWVHLRLGEQLAGGHTLRLTAEAANANINLDGFYVTTEEFQPPITDAATLLINHRVEQIAYRPSRQILDGVEFQFIDPAVNQDRGIIMVSGSVDGESRSPAFVEIPLPNIDIDALHFCGQVAGPAAHMSSGSLVAEYELRFEDGLSERLILTAGDLVHPTWEGLGVLSYDMPEDRVLESVVFRGLSHDVSVALAAMTLETYPPEGPNVHLTGSDLFHGMRAHGVISATGFAPADNEPALTRSIELEPGAAVTYNFALTMAENLNEAEQRGGRWEAIRNAYNVQRDAYQQWFDNNCPSFACSDPYITRLYWYRWFVARHNLSRARLNRLPYPYFFEGTHQSHFSRLIAFSSPHIIAETRWLRDPRYAFGQVRNHVLNADPEDRFFISAHIDKAEGEYNNWITQAAWQAWWVHPDDAWLKDVVSAMADDVLGTLRRFDRDGDFLPTPRNHWTTGMEFQPSFFYFSDYDNSEPDAPLERADFAAYLYGNARAVAEAYAYLGLPDEAERFDLIADQIRSSCLSKMWDAADRFLYAMHEEEQTPAYTREIVGFYPFAFGLMPDETQYVSMLGSLTDPKHFWTAYPPATVSRECPAFTPTISAWPAAGGRTHGCMWNGPTWPHATSVILDAAASALLNYDQKQITPVQFWDMFDRYTHLQFEHDKLDRPYVTEYYNSENGEPDPNGCPDYFHSTYNDLVIRYLVGLQPANSETLTLRPIPGPVDWFELRRVRYRDHDLDIVYNGGSGSGPRGLTVWIDGRWTGHRPTLGELTIVLPHSPGHDATRPKDSEADIYGELYGE
jgi:hypothetical protein